MIWLYANFAAASNPPETLTFMGCSAGAAAVIVTEAMRASQAYAAANTRIVAMGVSASNTLTEEFVHRGLAQWGVTDAVVELTAATNLSVSPLKASLLTVSVIQHLIV